MTISTSRGKRLWDIVRKNLQAFQRGPTSGAGVRQVLWGVTAKGSFVDGMTVGAFLTQAGKVLIDSGRVYRWQTTLCYEVDEPGDQQLIVLATQHKADPGAAGLLSNLLCVGVQGTEKSTQSLLPSPLVSALLADQDLWRRLPAIQHYTRRPLFDDHFNLCGPGWHAAKGVLVHGPDVEPMMEAPTYVVDARAVDRLPPLLGRLFADFCWASDADLANAVALLLTGFLANHFVRDPKPVGIIDGNQKGLGKTLLVQAFGRLLDDAESPRIPMVRDDELEKKLCAQLREARSGIFFFDNVRGKVESALVEANALSPVLSFRILGQSGNISRPNTFLWVITANQATGTEDLISRGLPIRLHYEGNPRERTFNENLLDFVGKHRLLLLGELAGMVLRWKQAGMPKGKQKHRCGRWAEVIGGILELAGLDGFLANVEEAEAAMDDTVAALTSLAEHVFSKGRDAFFSTPNDQTDAKGNASGEWVEVFDDAEVSRDVLAAKTPKGKSTWVGNFLGAKIGRKVEFTTLRGSGTATLRVRKERSRRKVYYFDIQLEDETTIVSGDLGMVRETDEETSALAQNNAADLTDATQPPSPPNRLTGAWKAGAARGNAQTAGELEWV